MIKLIKVFCITVCLSSCLKGKPTNNSEQKSKIELSKKQKHFTNKEELKKIISRKWVALLRDEPCGSFARTISLKGNYLYEYNGTEPLEYKIDTIVQIDSKTLSIKIEADLKYDVVFKVEILNFQEKLVKWSLNGKEYYKAKPYDILCGNNEISNIYNYPKKMIAPTSNWLGEYYFENSDIGKQIFITEKDIRYRSVARQHHEEYELISNQVADTLALYYYKGISHTDEFLKNNLPLIKIYKKSSKYYINTSLSTPENIEIEIEKLK